MDVTLTASLKANQRCKQPNRAPNSKIDPQHRNDGLRKSQKQGGKIAETIDKDNQKLDEHDQNEGKKAEDDQNAARTSADEWQDLEAQIQRLRDYQKSHPLPPPRPAPAQTPKPSSWFGNIRDYLHDHLHEDTPVLRGGQPTFPGEWSPGSGTACPDAVGIPDFIFAPA